MYQASSQRVQQSFWRLTSCFTLNWARLLECWWYTFAKSLSMELTLLYVPDSQHLSPHLTAMAISEIRGNGVGLNDVAYSPNPLKIFYSDQTICSKYPQCDHIRKTRKKLIWLSCLVVLMHLIKYIKCKLRWFKWQITWHKLCPRMNLTYFQLIRTYLTISVSSPNYISNFLVFLMT